KVVALAVLGHHACAVVADGRVACWGELPEDFPVPAGHPVKRLPPCPLDRAQSLAKFDADRAAAVKRTEDGARGCGGRGPDACLGCVVGCTEVPYLFRHEVLCQEPLSLPSTLAQRGITCAEPPRPAQWLSDKELQADTPEVVLTTTPVYLSGITDAVDVALP